MKRYLLLLNFGLAVYLCSVLIAKAQSTTITPGNNQPSLTATSTNNGILVPKITLTSSLNVASPVVNPADGLVIFNIGANQNKGFYYWTGSAWQSLEKTTSLSAIAPIALTSNTVKINSGTVAGQLLTWNGNNWINTNPKPSSTVIDNIQPSLVVNFSISLFGIYPSLNDDYPYIGEIIMHGSNFPPSGWALCNGALLSISENEVLFSLIGTTYGGDGEATFAVPDLRGRVPIQASAQVFTYLLGEYSGKTNNSIDNKY